MLKFAALVAGLAFAAAAHSQAFPVRPVKIVVTFPPGGNMDFIARTLQPKMQEYLGQPVLIDNKGGASGIIGAEFAAKSPADGYTLLLGNTGVLAINPATFAKLPYNPARDFAPLGHTSTNALMMTMSGLPANNIREFVAYAKANPGKVNVGIAGQASSQHFAVEMLKRSAGLDMLLVFYKGSGPVVTDLLGGQVHLSIDAPSVTMQHVKAGKMKALALTGKSRIAALPDVPTFDEAGIPGVDASGFQGFVVPAGTPPAAVAKLSEVLMKTLALPDVREKLTGGGLDVVISTPDQFGAFLKTELDKWARVAKEANIKAE
jgi:tripartite-type tricarboxylate transporter receptor subunit TctC